MEMIDYRNGLLEFGKELSVLYVEDEADAREQIAKYLSRFFKNVTQAVDGQDGVDKYKSGKFDLVVSDIRMPKKSGIAMSKEIKEIDSEQNILITSAHNDSEYMIELIDIGIGNYILKPIDDDKFLIALYRIAKTISDAKMNEEFQQKIIDSNIELQKSVTRLNRTIKELKGQENRTVALVEKIEENKPLLKSDLEFFKHKKRQKKISALEFDEIFPVSTDSKIIAFEELNDNFDLLINRLSKNIAQSEMDELSSSFKRYSEIMYTIGEFNNLAYSLEIIGGGITLIEDVEDFALIKDLLYAIKSNLEIWLNSVFIDKNAQDIHYLDDSMIGDAVEIERILSNKGALLNEEDESDDDIILF